MKAENRGDTYGFLNDRSTESTLISKASNGDKKAFELLMSNHLKIIYNYICVHVNNSEDIQDIVQETMLAVWSNLKSFGNNSSFKTWIIGIARRKICDYYRRAYKAPAISISEVEDSQMIEDESEKLIKAIDVSNLLANLSNTEQELVFLVFSAQMTYQEVSEVIQMPVGTVKSKMSAIKAKLRKHLERE